jgi:transposase
METRMARTSKLLTDGLVEKAKNTLKRLGKSSAIGIKLHTIILAKEHGITDVCRINGISRTTLTKWIKSFDQEEENGLKNKPKRPKSPLNPHAEVIRKWVQKDGNMTAKAIVLKVQETFKITVSKDSVYRLLKRLKLSYITPRPQHHKQDSSTHEEFKKKSGTKNS